MSSFRDRLDGWFGPLALVAAVFVFADLAHAQSAAYPNVGRAATPKEVQAWDIDVRPDLKGLPKGAGSVAKGMDVWESKCASCHGVFGESNEVFSPIVGGTSKDDIKAGRVARLTDTGFPGRTTLMKLPHVSTLWDYINRAMPWTAPKSLSTEEVYAVTAYILNMGGIVPDNFTLSHQNMAEVQNLLPNRNGMTTAHGLWPGRRMGQAKPDVTAQACVSNCATEDKVASFLPDFARNAHGNLAEQNRPVGAQRGADTTKPAGATASPSVAAAAVVAAAAPPNAAAPQAAAGADNAAVIALAQKHTCMACHGIDNKIVGPSFREIAKRYAGKGDSTVYLTGKIRSGGSGVWGAIPMPPQTLGESDAKAIAKWLADGAKK
jgi:S-disulfanyl-L-cysteine oxidoreductase SoxD